MKRIGFILALVFLAKIGFTQTPDLYWASFADYTGYDVAVDDMGNVYSMGIFGGTTDFDPGPGVFELTSSGETDIFVQKLDSLGNFAWAKQLGGPYLDGMYISVIPTLVPGTVVIDAFGDIIITATFADSADVDPGPNEHILAYGNGGNSFVVKLDPNGNFIWGKGLRSPSLRVEATSSATDSEGNVYTTGRFNGVMDADPSESDSVLLTTAGSWDCFVQKMDVNGNYVWSGRFGGSNEDEAFAIASSGNGNIYSTGYFRESVDFDLGTGVFELSSDSGFIYIIKFDTNGDLGWVRNFPSGGTGWDIQVDENENVYTFCSSGAGLDSDPGPDTVLLEGLGNGMQIHKMDSTGLFQWARHAYTESPLDYRKMTLDACGNIWGMFSASSGHVDMDVDLDPGPNVLNPAYEVGLGVFAMGLDSSGHLVWGGRLGGHMYGVGADQTGGIYYTGSDTDGDYDPGPNTIGSPDATGVLVKLSACELTMVSLPASPDEEVLVHPNPFVSDFRVAFNRQVANIEAEVCDIRGRVVWSDHFSDTQRLDIDLNVPPGIYFLQLELDRQPATLKLIKQ